MKYIRLWLDKQLSRSYERARLRGQPQEKAEIECEKFIDENRKRIQDLELVVKEMAQKLEQIRLSLNESGRH